MVNKKLMIALQSVAKIPSERRVHNVFAAWGVLRCVRNKDISIIDNMVILIFLFN